MRLIVDTNVLVSGLLSDTSAPALIVDAILQGRLIAVMSRTTFAELEEVLHRPRLQERFRRADVTPYVLLSELENLAEFVTPRSSKATIRDEKDRPFLELAAHRPPVNYIITGDKDFESNRYEDVPVISASLFAATVLRSK